MENTQETNVPVPASHFKQAFAKLFKCKQSDFDLSIIEEDRTAKVLYNQDCYYVKTFESLYNETKDMLTDKDEALHLDFSILTEAFQWVSLSDQFYLNLVEKLTTQEQFNTLQTVMVIFSQTTKKNTETFWRLMQEIDRLGELLGYAIVAAAQTVDLDRLADDVLDGQIGIGISHYNHYEGGIFELVEINVKNNESESFYIYTTNI